MKPFTLIAIAFLSALPAGAIIIEDSPERLVFDLTWNEGPYRTYEAVGLTGSDTGENGSDVTIRGLLTRNPWQFFVDIRRMVDGVFFTTTQLGVSFPGDSEHWDPVPDMVFGDPRLSLRESEWVLPLPGNPHGARIIRGLPYPVAVAVPDAGGTFFLLAASLAALAASGRRLALGRP